MGTIEKIHAEFDSATEQTLNAAIAIINNSNPVVIEKNEVAEKLQALGFVSSKTYEDYQSALLGAKEKNESIYDRNKTANEIASFINNSVYKIISYSQTMRICEKYGLFLGSARRFTGEIPLKNIEEISLYKRTTINIPMNAPLCMFSFWFGEDTIIRQGRHSLAFEKSNDFYIVAPRDEFNYEGAVVVGNEIFSYDKREARERFIESRQKIKDPVVLYPIECCGRLFFHVVSKWGLEAEIEEFHNPKDN
jgi:hypothetical protein